MKWFPAVNDDELSTDANDLVGNVHMTQREKIENKVIVTISEAKECLPDERISILTKLFINFPTQCDDQNPGDPLLRLKVECISDLLSAMLGTCILTPTIPLDGTSDCLDLQAAISISLYRHYERISQMMEYMGPNLSRNQICQLSKLCYNFGCGDVLLRLFNRDFIPLEHYLYTNMLEYVLPFFVHAKRIDKCFSLSENFLRNTRRSSRIVSLYNRAYNPSIIDLDAKKQCWLICQEVGKRLKVYRCDFKTVTLIWTVSENDCEEIGKRLLEFVNTVQDEKKSSIVLCSVILSMSSGSLSPQALKSRKRRSPPEDDRTTRRSGRGNAFIDSWVSIMLDSMSKQINLIKPKDIQCKNSCVNHANVDEGETNFSIDQSEAAADYFEKVETLKRSSHSLVDLIQYFLEILSSEDFSVQIDWPTQLQDMFFKLADILFELKVNTMNIAVYANYIKLFYLFRYKELNKSPFVTFAVSNLNNRKQLDDISLLVLAYYLSSLKTENWYIGVSQILGMIQDITIVLSFSPPMGFSHLSQKVATAICIDEAQDDNTCEESLDMFLSQEPSSIPDNIVDAIFRTKNTDLVCRMYSVAPNIDSYLLAKTTFSGDQHQFCIIQRLMNELSYELTDCDDFWIAFMRSFELICRASKPSKFESRFCNMFESIHSNIGRNACCTMKQNGKFLRYIVQRLAHFYQSQRTDQESAPILQHLQQAAFCLWGVVPVSRRDRQRYLVDHKCVVQPMSPSDCKIVFTAFAPDVLNAPWDNRNSGTDIDGNNLVFCSIVRTLNITVDKEHSKNLIDLLENEHECGQGWEETLLSKIKSQQVSQHYRDIFYFMADCYLKCSFIAQALENYQEDIRVVPRRAYSWAGLFFCFLKQIQSFLLDYEEGDHELNNGDGNNDFASKICVLIRKLDKSYKVAIHIKPEMSQNMKKDYAVIQYAAASTISKHLKRTAVQTYGVVHFPLSENDCSLLSRIRSRLLEQSNECFVQLTRTESDLSNVSQSDLCENLIWLAKILRRRNKLREAIEHISKATNIIRKENNALLSCVRAPTSNFHRILEIFYLAGSTGIKTLQSGRFEYMNVEFLGSLHALHSDFKIHERAVADCNRLSDEIVQRCASRTLALLINILRDDCVLEYMEKIIPTFIRVSCSLLLLVLYHQPSHYKSQYRICSFLHENSPSDQQQCNQLLRNFLFDGITSDVGGRRRKIIDALFMQYSGDNPFMGLKKHPEGCGSLYELYGTYTTYLSKSALMLIKVFKNDHEKLSELTQFLTRSNDRKNGHLNELDRISLCRIAFRQTCNAFRTSWPNINALSTSERRKKNLTTRQMLARMYRHYMIGPNVLKIDDPSLASTMCNIYTIITGKEEPTIDEVLKYCQVGLLTTHSGDREDD
ncbi:hypothetical protein ACOME3_003448 [Neoechinorhynchus agilis]